LHRSKLQVLKQTKKRCKSLKVTNTHITMGALHMHSNTNSNSRFPGFTSAQHSERQSDTNHETCNFGRNKPHLCDSCYADENDKTKRQISSDLA